MIAFESVFLFNMIVNFFTEYVPEGDPCPVRDLQKIFFTYLEGTFMRDFIPLFPITFFIDMSKTSFNRIFYLLKVMRLVNGLKIFNVSQIM